MLGEDGTKILDTPRHADLADYLRDVKKRGARGDLKCNNDADHSSKAEPKAIHLNSAAVINYFKEIDQIRNELNIFNISNVLHIILKAFGDEEAELKLKADHVRRCINAEARSSTNDDVKGNYANTHNNKPSLESIIRLQGKLEQVQEEKVRLT